LTRLHVPNAFEYRRRRTFEVDVGGVGVGGANPIRVQSMTTTDTQLVQATADQTERLADAGCEIVRITAPSIRDAEALGDIKAELQRRRVNVPLVADIHFTPNAAMEAALHVEKVRINPGNYADRKKFEVREYDDAAYREEVERMGERFRPLVLRCKELGRAMRIGTNHGSLSDRILNRFGDTPLGMVESALEFLDVCEGEGYRDVIFSMKASNPQVAVHAYRMLAARLAERAEESSAGSRPVAAAADGFEIPSYPFHVGVTEAGDGDDGRVKSAIGIGALLEDGIGDTIRVSLTEDPVKEVPVAAALAERYDARDSSPPVADPGAGYVADPFSHARRETEPFGDFGGGEPVRVDAQLGPVPFDAEGTANEVALEFERLGDLACEGLEVEVTELADVERLAGFTAALAERDIQIPLTVVTPSEFAPAITHGVSRVAVRWNGHGRPPAVALPVEWILPADPEVLAQALETDAPAAISVEGDLPTHAVRRLTAVLSATGNERLPIVLRHRSDPFVEPESAVLRAATDLGAALCDGIGDRVSLGGFGSLSRDVSLAYRILQGARLRTSWTEFISCPSCGRTLFDLEETTARVKSKTSHLPGLKIAVMGCVVNGPGEMADADFGYVGSGVGKVDLYVKHERVVRNVSADQAPDRLVDLIRDHGAWEDPQVEA
jgi:(E)-4-hydroxy-3-methylbut-2-enyl-diphosphate synthase